MNNYIRLTTIIVCLLIFALGLIACEKTKEAKQGKIIVTEKEFAVQQDSEYTWSLNATGKIKNVGEVDVKKVVVTGYCRSCSERMISGEWYITNVEKIAEQKDIISYLAAGDESEFRFKGIAYAYIQPGIELKKMPDNLEVIIESFEVVE